MNDHTVLFVGSLYRPQEKELPATATQQEKDAASKHHDEALERWNQQFPSFAAACRALGAAFAASDWAIMVGLPDWRKLHDQETVANYVIAGASSVPLAEGGRAHDVKFYGPRECELKQEPGTSNAKESKAVAHAKAEVPITVDDARKLPNLHFEQGAIALGNNIARLIPNVSNVGAVVVIGGGDGSATIGYAAYSMKKPVIAVTGFDGTAEQLERDVLRAEYEHYREHVGLAEEDLSALRATWSPDSTDATNRQNAAKVVRVTSLLVRAWGQTETQTRKTLKFADWALMLLLPAWLGIYLLGNSLAKEALAAVSTSGGVSSFTTQVAVVLFALLWITALLGCGLRLLSDYRRGLLMRLEPLEVLTETVLAMVVAFGLCLFYLIGGISITGEVVALAADTTKNFTMLAISMSLLGLAAGFLAPLDILRERLQNLLASNKATQPTG